MSTLLKFGHGNAKLPDSTLTFALPAGFTCPGALHCLAYTNPATGRVQDGPYTQFRCSAASEETRPSVRAARWHNWRLIRSCPPQELPELLLLSLRAARRLKSERVRWFTSGDCPTPALRDALIAAAKHAPDLLFYLYSKHLPLWLEGGAVRPLPDNLKLTASWGGRWDFLLADGLFPRTARVVNTHDEAYSLGLPLDFNDSHAWGPLDGHFAHLVHGTQPAGSTAGAAIAQRRKAGLFSGYSRTSPIPHAPELPPHAPALPGADHQP